MNVYVIKIIHSFLVVFDKVVSKQEEEWCKVFLIKESWNPKKRDYISANKNVAISPSFSYYSFIIDKQ